MKCPYCGFDSTTQRCERCFAVIAETNKKDEPSKDDEPVRVRRKKDKEWKDNGT